MANLRDTLKKGKEIVIFERNKLTGKKPDSGKEKEKLEHLVKMTENRLFSMSAVWPFDLFRNKVYIEEKQVILVYKQFFWVSQEYHILVEDILVPVVENSIFFSTLSLQLGPAGFRQAPPPIRFLPKKDADIAKDIIMGLIVVNKERINIGEMKKSELVKKLIEIGKYKKS